MSVQYYSCSLKSSSFWHQLITSSSRAVDVRVAPVEGAVGGDAALRVRRGEDLLAALHG